ncbi:MAG: hypothetical protein L6R38_001881 [Xanthoria sp. 2 TBL-2021]|nr:MAG: hypothetical protein L6R38_001881 [Xanthoria sp. 2 TBL-2021]
MVDDHDGGSGKEKSTKRPGSEEHSEGPDVPSAEGSEALSPSSHKSFNSLFDEPNPLFDKPLSYGEAAGNRASTEDEAATPVQNPAFFQPSTPTQAPIPTSGPATTVHSARPAFNSQRERSEWMEEHRRGFVPEQAVLNQLYREAHPEDPRFDQLIKDHQPSKRKWGAKSQLNPTQMSRTSCADVPLAKKVKKDDEANGDDDGSRGAREMSGFQMGMKIQRESAKSAE